MAKTKLSLLILGSLISLLLGALITYFLLLGFGQISGERQNIEITLEDSVKEYDGTELNASSYKITGGTLLKGHYIEIDYYGGITNAGSGLSDGIVKIKDESGKDFTNDYSINLIKGNLEITKRPITLAIKKAGTNYTNSDIVVDYDSDITDDLDYYVASDNKLCKGHKLIPDIEVLNIENVIDQEYGEANVNMVAEVYDVNGYDVTQNYSITYQNNQKIKVNKPVITLTTLSNTKTFDNEPFDEDDNLYVYKGDLPNGYKIDVSYLTNVSSIVNVSDSTTLQINTEETKIYDQNDLDVTDNFKIIAQNIGSLNIIPRVIDVKSVDSEFKYDGLEHTYNEFTLLDSADGEIKKTSDPTKFEYNGYEFNCNVASSTVMKDAGTKVNELKFSVSLANDSGNKDLSANFKFEYENVPLITVEKVDLFIGGTKTFEIGDTIEITDEEKKNYVSCDFNLDTLSIDYNLNLDGISEAGTYNIQMTGVVIQNYNKTAYLTNNFNIINQGLTVIIKAEEAFEVIIPYELPTGTNIETYIKGEIASKKNIDIDLISSISDTSLGINKKYVYNNKEYSYNLKAEALVTFKDVEYNPANAYNLGQTAFVVSSYNVSNLLVTNTNLINSPGVYKADLIITLNDNYKDKYVLTYLKDTLNVDKLTLTVKWEDATSTVAECTPKASVTSMYGDFTDFTPNSKKFEKSDTAFDDGVYVSYCFTITISANSNYYNIIYIPGTIYFE